MRGQLRRQGLVSMTNRDVYHISEADAKTLLKLLRAEDTQPTTFGTNDTKNGFGVVIVLRHISSIVVGDTFDE